MDSDEYESSNEAQVVDPDEEYENRNLKRRRDDDNANTTPNWVSKPDKKHLIEVLNGNYPNMELLRLPNQHSQSSGFSQLILLHSSGQIETAHVSCDNCGKIFGSNGGHLNRHRRTCVRGNSAENKVEENTQSASNKSELVESMIEYFGMTGKPLYSIENKHFQNFVVNIAKFGQRYDGPISSELIPSRVTIRSKIDKVLIEKIGTIHETLAPWFSDRSLAVLADFGKLKHDFLSVKVSFVVTETDSTGLSKWKTTVAPLSMTAVNTETKDAHTVFDTIETVLKGFDPNFDPRALHLVADAGSNIRKAGKFYFLDYVRCSAHATEIIGKRALEPYKGSLDPIDSQVLSKFKHLMEICRKITNTLKVNRLIYAEMKVSLVTPNTTRWMTAFLCVESVFSCISQLIGNVGKCSVQCHDWILEVSSVENRKLFADLKAVFEPLHQCILCLQSNSSTIADVLPAYLGLLEDFKGIAEKNDSSDDVKVVCKYATKAVLKQINDLSDCHFVGVYLNPYKKCIQSLQVRLDMHGININAYNKIDSGLAKIDAIVTTPPPPQPAISTSPSSSQSFYTRHLANPQCPAVLSLNDERRSYDNDPTLLDPLVYWPNSITTKPRLIKIAKKVFGTSATQADVERSFSLLKNTLTNKRESLDLEYLEKLLIVQQFDKLDLN